MRTGAADSCVIHMLTSPNVRVWHGGVYLLIDMNETNGFTVVNLPATVHVLVHGCFTSVYLFPKNTFWLKRIFIWFAIASFFGFA